MPLVSVKIVSVYAGVAHESVDAVEVNKDAIVMIKKVYYPIKKEVEENGKMIEKFVNDPFYKVSFMNGESFSVTETEKNKLS